VCMGTPAHREQTVRAAKAIPLNDQIWARDQISVSKCPYATSVRPWFAADPSCGEHFTRGKLALICGGVSRSCPFRLNFLTSEGAVEWLRVRSGRPADSLSGLVWYHIQYFRLNRTFQSKLTSGAPCTEGSRYM